MTARAARPTTAGAWSPALRNLVLVWAGWVVLLIGFQTWATARLDLKGPDTALPWTGDVTRTHQTVSPYANPALLATHVAWDSEYYLSIALGGYDDPAMLAVSPRSSPDAAETAPLRDQPGWTSLNYAFFPGYPMAIRAVATPLRLLGLDPIATAALAGVIVSGLGALAAMAAIAELARPADDVGEPLRSAWYLVAWPAGFFLLQVYSEGLFLGLSFGALAFAHRRRWAWAALLAGLAVWTRPTGLLLAAPFLIFWLEDGGLAALRDRRWAAAAPGLAAAAVPCAAYGVWRLVMGARFNEVEALYFGRAFPAFRQSAESLRGALAALVHGTAQAQAYTAVELASLAIAILASLAIWRRSPAIAVYGLLVLALSLMSGAVQGTQRYVLSAPAIFLMAARLGRSAAFDRLWIFGCLLVQAVFAATFSADLWAG